MGEQSKILALVLAGGQGTRLRPLTNKHAKPALAFAGGHRIVDFVLSNLRNSGISHVYVLAQYKPYSLIEHLRTAWDLSTVRGDHVLKVVLPRNAGRAGRLKGTADAVYQNLDLIERHRPDLVAVFAADHVYRMDIRQMVDFHNTRHADVTVAALPVPLERASSFGIVDADSEGRVREFDEKPKRPSAMPHRADHAYASMGNYLFRPEALIAGLHRAHALSEHDFGRHLLPRFARHYRTYAYDFATNSVPGVQPHEERAYWRDVGTLEAYRAALADTVGPQPRFQLWNPEWPIRGGREERTGTRGPEADTKMMRELRGRAAARLRAVEHKQFDEEYSAR
ncbi:MAG: sugar phosphate nucleotidyltransferase [Arenicellales bacterium]